MADTKIEWAEKVWNPVTGCTKVSQGCKNCYAEGIAKRFFATEYPPNDDGSLRTFTDVRCHEDRLDAPLHWRAPRRVFVNSMSDLFHESVPEEFIDRVFLTMYEAKQHTFQILTKRPRRMMEFMLYREVGKLEILPNVWLGVSVEDQKTADERIPLLLQTPAAVRWVSAEPLLGPIEFRGSWLNPTAQQANPLGWVVVGGESGHGARPMHPDWARSLRDQCQAANVPFFFKQWGGVRKKAAGRLLDGREWNEYPEAKQYDPSA